MFFTFPEDARWNAERQAVEFGVEIGEYHGVVRVPRCVFQRLLPERPTPEKCVEAYYLQRTRLETIAERKLRRRQLTEDGNVEISETSAKVPTADIHYACPNRRSRPFADLCGGRTGVTFAELTFLRKDLPHPLREPSSRGHRESRRS
jgi:Protein of unknown function (DUF1488)